MNQSMKFKIPKSSPVQDQRKLLTYDDESQDLPKNAIHVRVDVEIVPMRAFQQFLQLRYVSFSSNVKRLERQALQRCVSLQKVKLPPPTTKIGIRCFDGCQRLVVADLSECSVFVLMTQCFRNCTSLELVSLPRNLEVIARDAFRGCRSLKMLPMQDTRLKIIGKRAISDCKSLQTIKLPPTTEQLSRWAFAGCTALTVVEAPSSFHIERDHVFKNCPRLQRILPYTDQEPCYEEEEIVFYESEEDAVCNAICNDGLRSLQHREMEGSDSRQNLESIVEEATQNAVQEQLDVARQRNIALSQQLKNVCDKLETYESQWSTMVEQLKFASLGAMDNHQTEQERELQAKEEQLDLYKGIVESQRKRIWEMKMEQLGATESSKRPSTLNRQDEQDCASMNGTRGNDEPGALERELCRLDIFEMPPIRTSMESTNILQSESVLQAPGGERTTPVPLIIDDGHVSLVDSEDFEGRPFSELFRVHQDDHQDTISVDSMDLLITQAQQGSEGSEESNESWQVM